MKRFYTLFVILTLSANALPFTRAEVAAGKDKFRKAERPIANRYIVVLNDVTNARFAEQMPVELVSSELSGEYGGQIDKIFKSAIKGYAVEMTPEAAEALSRDARVKYVEEDAEITAASVQTGAGWGLDRIDQRNLPLEGTYNYASTGSGVNAYVIDSGIRASHADFGGRVRPGFDVFDDGQNGNDCHGHGTHVAGTLGSATYGVAKNVALYPVRVLNCSGSGTVSGIMAGVDWVTANHIKPAVANISVTANGPSSSLDAAVTASIAAGVTYAIAAANNSSNACNYSPGSTPNAITVGATAIGDQRPGYSNFGPCLDLFAPGHSITSAGIASDTASAIRSGSSMASPHAAGVAALFLETNPTALPSTVTNAIKASATPGLVTNIDSTSPNLLLYSVVAAAETITGVSPSGGYAYAGSPLQITWTNTGGFDNNVTIELSTDAGATFPTIIAANIPNTGSHVWMVPDISASQARIRVREYDLAAPAGTSSANFLIAASPSAAVVTLSGRVTDANGTAVRKAYVNVTDAGGTVRQALTNAFGGFRIDVDAGQTYIVNVVHKRYRFETRVVTMNDDLAGIDFIATP